MRLVTKIGSIYSSFLKRFQGIILERSLIVLFYNMNFDLHNSRSISRTSRIKFRYQLFRKEEELLQATHGETTISVNKVEEHLHLCCYGAFQLFLFFQIKQENRL